MYGGLAVFVLFCVGDFIWTTFECNVIPSSALGILQQRPPTTKSSSHALYRHIIGLFGHLRSGPTNAYGGETADYHEEKTQTGYGLFGWNVCVGDQYRETCRDYYTKQKF